MMWPVEEVGVRVGLWVMGYGLWVMGYGLWVMGYGLWVMGYGLWVMGYGLWVTVNSDEVLSKLADLEVRTPVY
jgi:hypothetical protein